MLTPEEIAKLPKKVQHHIFKIERDNADLKDTLMAFSAKEKTHIIVNPYNDSIYVPDDMTVRFVLEDDKYADYIDVSLKSLRGEACVYVNSGSTLAIQPNSWNTAMLYPGER